MKFLFNEQPIFANKTLAKELGLNEAIILQQINYWIEENKRTGRNYFEGKYWTYNSIRAWHEECFEYLSIDTVRRTFTRLEKQGYLLTGNFNKEARDQTKWYSINEEKINELYEKVKREKEEKEMKALEIQEENALEKNLQMENMDMQSPFVQNAQMQMCKMPNANVQNAQMQMCKMPRPLPNDTSYNTLDTSLSIHHLNKSSTEFQKGTQLDEDKMDIKSVDALSEELKKQIDFDILISDKTDKDKILSKNVLEIMCDILILQDDVKLKVNGYVVSAKSFKSRIKQINSMVFEYIISSLKACKSEIKNMYGYILTSIYNAPITFELDTISIVNRIK